MCVTDGGKIYISSSIHVWVCCSPFSDVSTHLHAGTPVPVPIPPIDGDDLGDHTLQDRETR